MSSEVRGGTELNPIIAARSEAVPKLVAVTGPSAGRAFAVTRATATVGRHPTNDFVVDDPRVSGAHVELSRVGDRMRVKDLGSTNGTYLNGRAVASVAPLGFGDEVSIGQVRLRLERPRST
jgi:pSer/pThr/pTyr-binding forkhead associated (FHA) protein